MRRLNARDDVDAAMERVLRRLDAPDLALAEAGIGAGLAGALLLAAVRRLAGPAHPEGIGDDEQP